MPKVQGQCIGIHSPLTIRYSPKTDRRLGKPPHYPKVILTRMCTPVENFLLELRRLLISFTLSCSTLEHTAWT